MIMSKHIPHGLTFFFGLIRYQPGVSVAWCLCMLLLIGCQKTGVAEYTIQSPSQRLAVDVTVNEGELKYSVSRDDELFLNKSALQLHFGEDAIRFGPLEFVSAHIRENETSWTPVWGKSSIVDDHYTELTVQVRESEAPSRQFSVIFRAYNDGVAFRYHIPKQPSITAGSTLADSSEFNFTHDLPTYYIGEEVEEAPTELERLSDFTHGSPPLLQLADSNFAVALHEAALVDYEPLRLQKTDKIRTGSGVSLTTDIKPSPIEAPFDTPWRVLMVSSSAGTLLESRLLETLSPPSKIEDTSWIQPGKAIWDRRIRKLSYGDIYYWFNTETFIHLIDFAADNNIPYMLMDSNWYGNQRDPKSDPLTPDERIDIKAVFQHAKEKDVKVMLYVNDLAFQHHDIDEVFSAFHAWGAAGVKYGFMEGHGYEKVQKTLNAIETAARHQLLIDFHDGPIHPTGLQRTYPNLITIEFCHAQADAIRMFTPGDFLKTVFVHMLAGPIDMNNGFYALDTLDTRKTAGLDYILPYPPLYATVAAETARILITNTGLSVLPDAPEEYRKKDDLFEFVRQLPNAKWDETKILNAKIGEYITTARRYRDEWFLGSVMNEKGGTLEINLDFLSENTTYTATLYEDAQDSHYRMNREAYSVRTITVQYGDTITAKIAPGGGHSVWIRPQG